MSQRFFSYAKWTIRLFTVIAALLQPGKGIAQGALTLTVVQVAADCGEDNGTIYASATGGAGSYSFEVDGPPPNSSGIFTGLAAGQHLVNVTDISGNSASYLVIVNTGCLVVDLNTESATCGNANGVLTVTVSVGAPTYQYSINGGGFQASNVFNNLVGETYTITVQDQDNNLWSGTTTVSNLPGATVSATPGPASCLNDDGTVTVTTVGGTPPLSYDINGGTFGTATQFTGVASGPQTVSVKDGNGCVTSTTATVPLNNNLGLTVDAGATICQGTTITLSAVSNAASFTWTPADGLSTTAIADPVAEPAATTTYNLTAVLGICTLTGSETITVLPAPIATAGAPDTICSGKSAELAGSGGVQYQWSPATYLSDPTSANPTVQQPAGTITYSLTVTGANGCASIQPATEQVYVTPPPVVFAGDDTAVLSGQTVPLDAIDVNHSGFTSYLWAPIIGLSNSSIQDPVAQITGSITYSVVATTSDGCVGRGSIVIEVVGSANIVVANAFTPNGDGHNDILHVDAIGIRDFKYFSIFNRWGQEVFTTNNEGVGWDGMRGGQVQPAGVYVWMAMGLDFSGKAVERKGTVILIR